MRAIAHSPSFAKKVGVKQSVGKDFEMADKKRGKFGSGGQATAKPRPFNDPDSGRIPTKSEAAKLMAPTPPKVQPKKDRDTLGMKKYATGGGVTKAMPTSKQMGDLNMAKGGGIEKKGKTNTKMVKMAKGGSIDGIARKGKTKTAYPKMAKGGKC
jgi:hypothetical protein